MWRQPLSWRLVVVGKTIVLDNVYCEQWLLWGKPLLLGVVVMGRVTVVDDGYCGEWLLWGAIAVGEKSVVMREVRRYGKW